MRSPPNQLIASARALLRDVILPELQSDLARARLRQVLATLRDVDWDDATLALARENELLRGLLSSPASDASGGVQLSAAWLQQENRSLRQALSTRFAKSPGWTEDHRRAAQVLAEAAAGHARGAARSS